MGAGVLEKLDAGGGTVTDESPDAGVQELQDSQDSQDSPEPQEPQEPVNIPDPNDELRIALRQLRRENADLQNELLKTQQRVDGITNRPEPQQHEQFEVLYDADGNERRIPIQQETPPQQQQPTQTEFDTLKESVVALEQQKAPLLSTIYETMKLSPAFADLDAVIGGNKYNQTIDELVQAQMTRSGEAYAIADLRVREALAKLPNPYAFIYKIRKDADAQAPQPRQAPATAPSLATTDGGAGSGAGAWTAKKIDSLDETELSSVPPDIYKKYLNGTLK